MHGRRGSRYCPVEARRLVRRASGEAFGPESESTGPTSERKGNCGLGFEATARQRGSSRSAVQATLSGIAFTLDVN
jgi:hypothetical protein